jgi:hypothetical protein
MPFGQMSARRHIGAPAEIKKNFAILFSKSQLSCPNMQAGARGRKTSVRPQPFVLDPFREGVMLFVAGALAVLAGLFYAAEHHEIGSFGVTMCQYGSTFCDNPSIVFVGAVLAALWGTFVSMR